MTRSSFEKFAGGHNRIERWWGRALWCRGICGNVQLGKKRRARVGSVDMEKLVNALHRMQWRIEQSWLLGRWSWDIVIERNEGWKSQHSFLVKESREIVFNDVILWEYKPELRCHEIVVIYYTWLARYLHHIDTATLRQLHHSLS